MLHYICARGLKSKILFFSALQIRDISRVIMSQNLHKWVEGWAAGRTSFHRTYVHKSLLEFHAKLLVKKPSRVLVPLCGKTLDMRWFSEEGHEVVGVEGVRQAVLEFFQEQELPFKESDVPGVEGVKLFENEDKKIKIYLGDFFKFSKDYAGEFDAIWDRGSLVAIDPSVRQQYTDVLLSVLSPGGRILSEVFEYNTDEMKGPPHSVPEEDIQKLFGEKFTRELLADDDALDEIEKEFEGIKLTRMRLKLWVLIPK